MSIETKSTEWKILKLAGDTGRPEYRLSDQNIAKFGTNRKTEIAGIIGDTGVPWEKLYTDYLASL